MINRKTRAATSMINSVVGLLEASQTVRLLRTSEDGSRNGNRLTPAVATTPVERFISEKTRRL